MPSSEINSIFAPLDLSRFFEQQPMLETERLLLRSRTMEDKNDIFEYASDPEVTQYVLWPTHRSIEDTISFLESSPKNFAKRESIGFAIELKETGKMIGDCGFLRIEPKHHRTEIGYVLNRNCWSKGYMTEAVQELIRFAFQEMGMHRVAAICDATNIRSSKVMERCGMSFEGTLRDHEVRIGKFVSIKTYAIVNVSQTSV
jgi:ribosomal-protein-alanine N-acetyltransferase